MSGRTPLKVSPDLCRSVGFTFGSRSSALLPILSHCKDTKIFSKCNTHVKENAFC